MRNRGGRSLPPPASERLQGDVRDVLRRLLPYFWRYRARVVLALVCMGLARLSNVGGPIILKHIVDALTPLAVATGAAGAVGATAGAVLVVPLGLLLLYGAMRLAGVLFTELRELVFMRVTQEAVRALSVELMQHLHALSLRFHLERQTGGVVRDIERGTQAISSLVSYSVYSILPTLLEMGLVLTYLVLNYRIEFALITAVALLLYIAWTIGASEWRVGYRRRMNEMDSRAQVRSVDALLNYETVKYFGQERYEAHRYDAGLRQWAEAAVRSQASLSLLNLGQATIIALAVTAMLWQATAGVAAGEMTVGDLVLVNAFMIQLYAPLNFLGVIYRSVRQGLTDLERMFALLAEPRDITDAPGAQTLQCTAPVVQFDAVQFGYHPQRTVLQGVTFTIGAGQTLAVVGSSGSGKTTLSRLLFRFYDVTGGAIRIDGQDVRSLTQESLRAAIGIVPQDTVLFNDTIRYNIAYARPEATDAQVRAAVRAARLDGLIDRLPQGWDTPVGERGLKLSGGEKQRVAIARLLLKNPAILVLDEATSALDSTNEAAIQQALQVLLQGRTALVIAHRLSTVVGADRIVVLHEGQVVESGRHDELLAQGGHYAQLWALQSRQQPAVAGSAVPAAPTAPGEAN